MKKTEGKAINVKINGEFMSFCNKESYVDMVTFCATRHEEPIKIEPIGNKNDYDHMQEIMDRCYEGESYLKGIGALATEIQRRGNFNEQSPLDINWLALRCKNLIDEILEISDAANNVYEAEWARVNAEAEARQKNRKCQDDQSRQETVNV